MAALGDANVGLPNQARTIAEALGGYQVYFSSVDAEGGSEISGADFAQAFVDEIEAPRHRRARFTVAY